MRNVTRLVAGLALGLLLPRAARSDECTRFTQDANVEERQVTFRFENKCEKKLSCSLVYKVACGADETAHQEDFTLDQGTAQHFEASARACPATSSWRIDPPHWQCKETI